MTLARTTLRKDAVTRLVAASTAAGARVYSSRVRPIRADTLATDGPVILVYIASDDSERIGNGPTYRTALDLVVEAAVASDGSGEDIDDAIDDLSEEILAALLGDPAWVDQFEEVPTVEADLGRARDAGYMIGVVAHRFGLVYTTDYTASQADDWDLASIEIDTIDPGAGPDGAIEVALDVDMT